MSTQIIRSSAKPPDVFYYEILAIFCAVWHHWSWDAALITAVLLMVFITGIGHLGLQATNVFCQLVATLYGATMLFILLKADASFITCIVFVPFAAAIGYSIHILAIAHQGILMQAGEANQ